MLTERVISLEAQNDPKLRIINDLNFVKLEERITKSDIKVESYAFSLKKLFSKMQA
jgi:hypothetical protein